MSWRWLRNAYFMLIYAWGIAAIVLMAACVQSKVIQPRLLGWTFFVVSVGFHCRLLLLEPELNGIFTGLSLANLAAYGLFILNLSNENKAPDGQTPTLDLRFLGIRIMHLNDDGVRNLWRFHWFLNATLFYSLLSSITLVEMIWGVSVIDLVQLGAALTSCFAFVLLAFELKGGSPKEHLKEMVTMFTTAFRFSPQASSA